MKKPIKLVYLFWSWSESVSWTWEPDQSDSWMVFKWSWLNGWSSTQITLNSSFTNWTDQVLVFNWIWPERFLLTQLTAQELYQIRERIIQFCILYWSLTYVVTIHELSLNTRKTYMKTSKYKMFVPLKKGCLEWHDNENKLYVLGELFF